MNRYIVFDVETGGIGLDKSLLTACFLYCQYDVKNDEYEIIEKEELNGGKRNNYKKSISKKNKKICFLII